MEKSYKLYQVYSQADCEEEEIGQYSSVEEAEQAFKTECIEVFEEFGDEDEENMVSIDNYEVDVKFTTWSDFENRNCIYNHETVTDDTGFSFIPLCSFFAGITIHRWLVHIESPKII